jgi:Domain of unknown function (DUF4394)
MLRARLLPTAALAGLLAAVLTTPAGAAQSFAGILEDGRLVRFTSQAPISLTTPVRTTGLEPGEQILALSSNTTRIFALGSAARLYAMDVGSGRATPVAGGRPLAQGLRGRRFSLAVSPDGARARILSDVGQDVTVDLATGAETPGPGLRTEDGAPTRPAATTAPDGRLVGVDLARRILVRETAPGSGVMTATPLGFDRAEVAGGLGEPTGFALGSDGRGFLLSALLDRGRDRQSQLLRMDAGSADLRPSAAGTFLRRIVTVGAIETVPEDTTAPRASITVPRRMSVRRLLARRSVPVAVRLSEAAQLTVSLRVGRRVTGLGFRSRDVPARHSRMEVFLSARDRRALRAAVGRRIRVVISTNDFKGNGRSITRSTRLTR